MRKITVLFTALILSVSGLVSTAAQAAIPSNGTYLCKTGVASRATPNFTITGGVVTNGQACVGVVKIPNGVTSIGDYGFQNGVLTSITLPAGLKSIGIQAFGDADKLTSLTIPNSVTTISEIAFWNADSLTSVTLPTGLTSIAEGLFKNDSSLTSITIKPGIKSIAADAFDGDSSLASLTIPASVTRIDPNAFGSAAITTLRFMGPIDAGSIDNGTVKLPSPRRDGYAPGDWYSDPTFTTKVGDPGSEYSVTAATTLYAKWIRDIGIPDDGTYDCQTGTPSNATPNYKITGGAVSAGDACVGLVVIPTGVTIIDSAAFKMSETVTGINLPASLTTIRDEAFMHVSYMNSITIPDGVSSIGRGAFDTSWLTSITIPDGVSSIEEGTFKDNELLTSVTLPAGLTNISSDAFNGVRALSSITIPQTVTNIGSRAFSNTGLTSITIPDGVSSIEEFTLAYNPALTSVTLPAGLTNISRQAFIGDTALSSIAIPTGVVSIGEGAFDEDTALSSIAIPASVTQIHPLALRYSFGLMSIVFLGPIDAGSPENGTIFLPQPELARANYTFVWYADARFTTKVGNGGSSYRVASAKTLYAKWTSNTKVKAAATTKPGITGIAIATTRGTNKLTAAKGVWTGNPDPSISFQWYSCTVNVAIVTSTIPRTCTLIENEKQSTLKVTLPLKSKFIAVAVTGKSEGTTATTWLSKSTAQVK